MAIPLDPTLQAAAAPVLSPATTPPALAAGTASLSGAPSLPANAGVPTSTLPAAIAGQTPAPQKPLSFGEKLAREAAKLFVPGTPGAYSRAVLGGAMNALSGDLGDAAAATEKVPAGSGALGGIERTLAARSQRLAAQKDAAAKAQQQAIENARADKQLALDTQRTDAQVAESKTNIAHANIEAHNALKAGRNADLEFRNQQMDTDQNAAKFYEDQGATPIGQHLTTDQLKQQIAQNPRITSTHMVFIDGYQPATDANGKPLLDADGNPQYAATYTLLRDVPSVTLTKDQAELLNKYNPPADGKPWTAGTPMSGSTFYLLQKRALSAQTVQMNVEATQAKINESLSATERNKAETRNANLSNQEKQANVQTAKDFAPILAQTNGDPILAMQNIQTSIAADQATISNPQATPQARQQAQADLKTKNGLAGRVEQLYGPGTLTKAREETLANLNKTIEDDQKALNNLMNPPSAEDAANLQSEIKSAQAQRNLYLGLHNNAPDNLGIAANAIDKLPKDQQAAAIVGAKSLNAAQKAYLLKQKGFPVPANLQ